MALWNIVADGNFFRFQYMHIFKRVLYTSRT